MVAPLDGKTATAAKVVLPHISSELLDQIVTGPMTQQGIEEVMRGFKKALIERALGAEMSHHLGYASGGLRPVDATNQRNGNGIPKHASSEVSINLKVRYD